MPILIYFGLGMQLVLVATAVVRFRSVSDEMKLLAALFTATFLISSFQVVLTINTLSSLWIQHFTNLLSFCFYLTVFSYWQPNKKIGRMFRREFIIVYCVVWLASKVSIGSFESFDYFSSAFAKIVTLCVVCYTMITSVDRAPATLLYDRFLILSGVLISSITGAFFTSSPNLVLSLQHDEMLKIWSIHWAASIVANILFTTAFLLKRSEADTVERPVGLPFAYSTLLKKHGKDRHSRYIN